MQTRLQHLQGHPTPVIRNQEDPPGNQPAPPEENRPFQVPPPPPIAETQPPPPPLAEPQPQPPPLLAEPQPPPPGNIPPGGGDVPNVGQGPIGQLATVLLSTKGKEKLECGGFLYTRHKKSTLNDDVFFVCELNKKNKCKARIHVRRGHVIKNVNRHNHAPDGQRRLVVSVSKTHIYNPSKSIEILKNL